jgi:formyl-CoA transferase
MFRRLCDVLGVPELKDNPDYRDGNDRSRHRATLNPLLAARTKTGSTAQWIAAINEAGVPCGPIYSLDQTMNDPQVKHLGLARPVDHPRMGAIEVVGPGVNLARTSQPPKMRPTPEMGQHTDEVLASLGYDAAAIAGLRAKGAV